ncbi:SAM-dependent methyltransferase [Streptomyces sp. NBC_01497]|uniref:SAM-dependent methyltransferase n=1 Tax=Streptomyces sp. NBC_01497 TaxID=2903885 RepID=UPI002E332BE1|nr:SAM-dependent methyltransferase [Streptomyces sp. NBC_01497]
MTQGTPKPRIDTSKPHPARVYDWLLGGKDNYLVDQAVGDKLPEDSKAAARQNRAFMQRAVAWAAREGFDQYLDIGTGIPTQPNLHQIVQRVNPGARIVYTDFDPIVLRHAEALLISSPEGTTDYIQADVRDPATIVEHARKILDFDRPVVLSLIALMHFIQDEEDPYGIVRTLVDALPSGSLLIFSHGTTDFHPAELVDTVKEAYKKGTIPLRFRTREETARFFTGLEPVEPGLVTAPEWYKDEPRPEEERSGIYAAVLRVP